LGTRVPHASIKDHKGTAALEGKALIGTIVPQVNKKDQNDKRGRILLGTLGIHLGTKSSFQF